LLGSRNVRCWIVVPRKVQQIHQAKIRMLPLDLATWCILSDTFCWLSQRLHVWSWILKMSWKACIQANATVSSEFGADMFSRFRFQVRWLEPDAFWSTLYSYFATEKTTYRVTK
jgi:hypothetical protein